MNARKRISFKIKNNLLYLFFLSFLHVSSQNAVAISFYNLGTLTGGTNSIGYKISSDGSVACAISGSNSPTFYTAFRWTVAGGAQSLGTLAGGNYSYPTGVNSNGSVIAGWGGINATQSRAFRWTQAGGLQNLGTLTGGTNSYAQGINSDGTVVVGSGDTASGWRAFRWTQAGGMQSLGSLGTNSFGAATSSDGSVIVGASDSKAFKWTQSNGMQALGALPGATISSARDISSDGSVVVGLSQLSITSTPVRWTASGGIQSLGRISTSEYQAYANAVSADGAMIVGCSISGASRAFLWTETDGIKDLKTYLESLGLDLSQWNLSDALDISDDGDTIVGAGYYYGESQYGQQRAFVVTGFRFFLKTSVNNSIYGSITAGGTKSKNANETIQAIPNPGYVFTGWSGDVYGLSNPLTVTMSGSKSVIANYTKDLGDNDSDGISNYDEIVTYESNPNLKDSNSDGVEDAQAVALGYSPSLNFTAFIGHLQSHPPTGLYTASQMQAMAFGDLVLTKNANGSFTLNCDIEQSTDLQNWSIYAPLSLPLTNLPPDKAFVRIKPKQ